MAGGGPRIGGGNGGGFNMRNKSSSEAFKTERILNKLPEVRMVVTLMEEKRRRADQSLLAFRVSRPE